MSHFEDVIDGEVVAFGECGERRGADTQGFVGVDVGLGAAEVVGEELGVDLVVVELAGLRL
jgi:hypothetical protein